MWLLILLGFLAPLHAQRVSVQSGKELAQALASQADAIVLARPFILLSGDDFAGSPILLTKNVSILGSGAFEATLRILAIEKVQLGQGVTLRLSNLLLEHPAKYRIFQEPGLVVLVPSPAPGGARLVLEDVVMWGSLCFPPTDRPEESSREVPRPLGEGGVQNYTATVPQTGCANTTHGPVLQRCWPDRASWHDFALAGQYVDNNTGTQKPNNYTVRMLNVTFLCREMLTPECIASVGPFACYLSKANNVSLPPMDLSSLSSADPEASEDGDGRRLAILLGCILGGVGAMAVAGAAVVFLLYRRGQSRGSSQCHKASLAVPGREVVVKCVADGDLKVPSEKHATPIKTVCLAGLAPPWTYARTVSTVSDVVVLQTPYQASLVFNIQVDESGVDTDASTTAVSGVFEACGFSSMIVSTTARAFGTDAAAADSSYGYVKLCRAATPRLADDAAPSPLNGSTGAFEMTASVAACTGDLSSSQRGGAEVVQLLPVVRGRGAFGRVTEGLWRGQRVAVKQMLSPSDGPAGDQDALVSSFVQEVEVLGRCQHPNVVKLLAVQLFPPKLALVMELMETSLEQLIFRSSELLPLPKVLHIAIQVCSGLEYLHPTIIHRDLKPANVLINSPTSDRPIAKLTDFGLARIRLGTMPTMEPEAGTTAYVAPECFDVNNNVISYRVDMYALGVLLWAMLTGSEPWKDHSVVAIAFKVSQGQRLPLENLPSERCPPKLRKLIGACWDADPRRRPAAAEAMKELLVLQEQIGRQSSSSPRTTTSTLPSRNMATDTTADVEAAGGSTCCGSQRHCC